MMDFNITGQVKLNARCQRGGHNANGAREGTGKK
jgi:hypothetical protein